MTLSEMLLRFKCPKEKKKQFPLMGKVFCGCCEHAMQRVAKKTPVFRCRYTDVIKDFSCYNLSITEQELSDIIFQILKKQAEVIFALNEVTDAEPLEVTLKQQDLYAKQIENMKMQKTRLYEQLMMKEISLDEYKQCKADIDVKLTFITNSYNNTTQRNDQLLRTQEEKEKRLSVSSKITAQKSLTKELVDLLIDKVNVFPNNQIEIAWKIKDFA